MLKGLLPRPEAFGGGSFNPRNDGPLTMGASLLPASFPAGVTGTAAVGASDIAREFGLGGAGGREAADAGGATGRGICAGGGVGCNIVAPHIPQKRFVSGFSLPHLGQRTEPPKSS